MTPVPTQHVRDFWESHPVAARQVAPEPGTPAYFTSVDALREAPACEPYEFSNRIHGYTQARGARVLDVGCGHGYVLAHYAKSGAEVHGLDLTERALDVSRRRFEWAGLSGRFTRTDGDQIPYPDAHFDIACSMGVLHHIADPRPMLSEMRRVLRPGGKLILMLYNRRSFRNWVTFPFRKFFGAPGYRGKSLQQIRNMNDGADCPLALVYSKAEVRRLLEPGFDDLRFTVNKLPYEEVFLFLRGSGRIARLLGNPSESFLARTIGWNLYIQATRR
jgi:SAM-dependent methyltransferase